MGLIGYIMSAIFGDGRNAVAETAEVFRVNAERADARGIDLKKATLAQFAAEFSHARRGLFDRFVDALNRLPRPMLALGTIALFVTAMYDPDGFAVRMRGVAAVPEPLWWLMGAIVSFYFGARHQAKGQEFQRSILSSLPSLRAVAETGDAVQENAALDDWKGGDGR